MISNRNATLAGKLIAAVLLVGLTGCNMPSIDLVNTPNATGVYFTAVAMMTEKAATLSGLPTQPAATPVPEVITPTAGHTPVKIVTVSLSAPTATPICELVSPGTPLDVTIPDDTRMMPGDSFAKIWRLVNDGSCTWTNDYTVVWFSGDDLGVESEQEVPSIVSPGESIDINVDMVAPTTPGVYSSYWMLRSDRGVLFGLGPNGDAPFWVKIQVLAVNTPTPTPTLIPSVTPQVEISGEAGLTVSQSIDLDTGAIGQGDVDDLRLDLVEPDQYQLAPVNSARIGVFGMLAPTQLDCSGAVLTADPVSLSELESGVWLCYRTNSGLPGSLHLPEIPVQNQTLKLRYLTWVAP